MSIINGSIKICGVKTYLKVSEDTNKKKRPLEYYEISSGDLPFDNASD